MAFPKPNTNLMRAELELKIWIIWAGALFSYYHALMHEDVYLNGPAVPSFNIHIFKIGKLHFKTGLFYFDLCMFLCESMQVCMWKPTKTEESVGFPGRELRVAVNCPMWLLRTELRSFESESSEQPVKKKKEQEIGNPLPKEVSATGCKRHRSNRNLQKWVANF